MQNLGQDFVLRPEGLHAPIVHDQNLIDAGNGAWAVGDDDDDALAFAHAENCAGQRFVALGVEVGVRLIENDQERIAVDRAGERDPLRLAGGKRSALLADRRVVALQAA